jgi:hypothetical protein
MNQNGVHLDLSPEKFQFLLLQLSSGNRMCFIWGDWKVSGIGVMPGIL